MTDQVLSILLLVFGFGFVIFFHELGHFLAAKWVGIKVEQFAVGFGQAMLAWRKGIGVRIGSTFKEYEQRLHQHLAASGEVPRSKDAKHEWSSEQLGRATEALNLGETEYRLNWIPLGGYVKMLGQDDLRPNAQQDDPRAYNRKSIGDRMLVVSAGVIMNMILAAIGFMVLFMIGFNAPPAVVGSVIPNSPAAKAIRLVDGQTRPASLQVGDRILKIDGETQHDFTKVTLNVALLEEGVPVDVQVRRRDGTEEVVSIAPERAGDDKEAFLMFGIGPGYELRGLDPRYALDPEMATPELLPKDMLAIRPGDLVTHINGKPVEMKDFPVFDAAVQGSKGAAVELTIRRTSGATETISIQTSLQETEPFSPFNIAGLIPQSAVRTLNPESPARGTVFPDDVFVKIAYADGSVAVDNPTINELVATLSEAGEKAKAVDLLMRRDGKPIEIKGLKQFIKVARGRYGLGMGLDHSSGEPVVADVMDASPAQTAGIPTNSRILSVAGKPVESWADVKEQLAATEPAKPVAVVARLADGTAKSFDITLDIHQHQQVAGLRYSTALTDFATVFHDLVEPRYAGGNPLLAMRWGVSETRDFVLQFYLTLKRMVQGSVSYKNMMGPVGIFNAGRKFAYKGHDWLIWFLSMISANLAVVNFLPIPIVDGGLFTFLIIEKFRGRPLSAKTQSIAQVVGLALILSVFLLVTYQDIARMVSFL